MKNNKPHFLLIHGAWHGGWVWNEISEILKYQRYSVSTPTLTGLGEKKHLLSSLNFLIQIISINERTFSLNRANEKNYANFEFILFLVPYACFIWEFSFRKFH